MRRALDRHGAAAEQVRRLVLRPAEADLGQEVELEIGEPRVAHPEHVAAEVVAERVGVERVADVERARQRALEALQHLGREALRGERLVVDLGRADQRAAADRIAHDVVDLLGRVAERGERARHHAVDDLEVAAARQLLELDQREVGLDAGGVAVHDQADRAGRRDHRGLGVAIAVRLAPLERLVPGRARRLDQLGQRHAARVERHRAHREALVVALLAVGRAPVIADHPQHRLAVRAEAGERAELLGHLRRHAIGGAGHQRGDRAGERARLCGCRTRCPRPSAGRRGWRSRARACGSDTTARRCAPRGTGPS